MSKNLLSPQEAEALIGHSRGALPMVTVQNRGAVRRYFTARGLPSLFVAGLAYKALHAAYNDTTDKTFARLQANACRRPCPGLPKRPGERDARCNST